MSRPILAAMLLLWSPAFALAQAGEAKPAAAQQDPQAAYQELAKAFAKAISDWRAEAQQKAKEAQAAAEAGKPVPAMSMVPPTKEFIARAQELAAEYAGKDAAVPFLAFICKNASNERNAVKKAVQTLAIEHAESAAIGDVLGHLEMAALRFGAKDSVMTLLDDVVAKNKAENCIAQALLVRGGLRLQVAGTDEERAAAKADLDRVATVTKDEELRKQAKDALFEIEHLQVGCQAPDIAAKDTDGVAFKLSDYRGKVVLLDFWGFW